MLGAARSFILTGPQPKQFLNKVAFLLGVKYTNVTSALNPADKLGPYVYSSWLTFSNSVSPHSEPVPSAVEIFLCLVLNE